MLSHEIIRTYVDILREELVPATGCTEPIAIAYAAALLRQTLGAAPARVLAEGSVNNIKNVKSVIVPNTGRLNGLPAARAAALPRAKAPPSRRDFQCFMVCSSSYLCPWSGRAYSAAPTTPPGP